MREHQTIPLKTPDTEIVGTAGGTVTWAGDLLVTPSLAPRNHSPTGFARGYGGSGPAQSAPALSHRR